MPFVFCISDLFSQTGHFKLAMQIFHFSIFHHFKKYDNSQTQISVLADDDVFV